MIARFSTQVPGWLFSSSATLVCGPADTDDLYCALAQRFAHQLNGAAFRRMTARAAPGRLPLPRTSFRDNQFAHERFHRAARHRNIRV
ncbi:hypothetical protein KCP75_02280 [Salmonella enterica subsp. enterica]|nr:hypothetical protein KCP75_02280 [Salmonella enterica subsp. enterica]